MRSKLSQSLSFISYFRLDHLSVFICFTLCLCLIVFEYVFACILFVSRLVWCLIGIKETHRKGSDAYMTKPHPFHAVTFSFVISCLIPCFLNRLFFTTPFLSPHSHRTQGITANPEEWEMTTVYRLSEFGSNQN